MTQCRPIGKVVRVEWNQQDNSVRLVMEITDEVFKDKVLHSKDYERLLKIDGVNLVTESEV